jgi:AcrR family transcriptional regulator
LASPIRAERALVTRRRMVTSAYRLFCAKGYLGTTMAAVAAEADVAVQTLYYTFHTKAELLGEALGAAVVGFDNWFEPPVEPIPMKDLTRMLPWWGEFESAASSTAALKAFIHNGVDVLERVGPLLTAMYGSAGDPEATAVLALGEERRVGAYRAAIRAIADKEGGLRPGIRTSEATDILVVVFSAEMYQALASGRGWSRARCERFLHRVLVGQLL